MMARPLNGCFPASNLLSLIFLLMLTLIVVKKSISARESKSKLFYRRLVESAEGKELASFKVMKNLVSLFFSNELSVHDRSLARV